VLFRSDGPIQLSHDPALSIEPRVATSGDTLHVLWYGVDLTGGSTGNGIQYSRSTDGGMTFSGQITLASADTASNPGLIATFGSVLCVAFPGSLGGIAGCITCRSTDAGEHWEAPLLAAADAQPRILRASDSEFSLTVANQRDRTFTLYRSTDDGLSWRSAATNLPALSDMQAQGGTLHGVGPLQAGLHTEVAYYTSTDQGVSWAFGEIVSPEDAITSLYPRIAVNEAGTAFITWNDEGSIMLRRSVQGEPPWSTPVILSEGKGGVFPDIDCSNGFVAVVWDNNLGELGGINYRQSVDAAESFCPLDTPTSSPGAGGPSLKLDGERLHLVWSDHADTNAEIFYRGGTLSPDLRPKLYALGQNFPNPFNGTTQIAFDLPAASPVTLALYNLLGERVRTILDGYLQPLRYTYSLESGGLPTGVYFYRLSTPSFTETKKLVILR
jgi:hypothetical protein